MNEEDKTETSSDTAEFKPVNLLKADDNTLILIALADIFNIPPSENQFGQTYTAITELKAALDGGLLQYPAPAKPPHEKFIVINITTSYGKQYTCRTVADLETFIVNYMKEKKFKRDEDVNIQIGWSRMNEEEFGMVPACKYFLNLDKE